MFWLKPELDRRRDSLVRLSGLQENGRTLYVRIVAPLEPVSMDLTIGLYAGPGARKG